MRLFLALVALCVFAASGVHAQQPPAAGQVLWLRADAGVTTNSSGLVTGWGDQSAAANDVVQFFPSERPYFDPVGLASRPALHFDGNDALLRLSGMPKGSYTKVVAFSMDEFSGVSSLVSGASEHALGFIGNDRPRLIHAPKILATSTVVTPLDTPTTLTATYDANNEVGVLYQDGDLVAAGLGPAHDDPRLEIGSAASAFHLRGRIAEVLIYDRVLNANELLQVGRYLEARYQRDPPIKIAFSKLPRDRQIYARNGSNKAILRVAGDVLSAGYDSIEMQVFRDGAPFAFTSQPLNYSNGAAFFQLAHGLDAGLFAYDIRVTLVSGATETLVALRQDIAVGDLYVVMGQSNAVASDVGGEGQGNLHASPWIRSFGTSAFNASVANDLHWDTANGQLDGQLIYNHSSVGAWALRMAKFLLDEHQVPVGLLNGGLTGTSISEHLRNDADPQDLTTPYGRLLFRAAASGFASGARALLWYQGEADGGQAAQYAANWDALYSDWKLDYPALQQIYLFQVRKGCGVNFAGVREVQRTLQDVYPDVQVMSTTAAPGHDGCHFLSDGYFELGLRMARLLSRDVHGSQDTVGIDAPNVLSARFTSPAKNEVEITFRDASDQLVWERGSEAFFVLSDGTAVSSGSVSAGHRVLLQLAGSSTASSVSYVGHSGDGPWVRNARGVGILSFFDLPLN